MTRPYDPSNPQDNLTETEAKIEGDLSYGLDLITRMLPAPVSPPRSPWTTWKRTWSLAFTT